MGQPAKMPEVLGIATVLGIAGVIATFGLFYLGEMVFHLGRETIQSVIYLKLSVAGHSTIFVWTTSTAPQRAVDLLRYCINYVAAQWSAITLSSLILRGICTSFRQLTVQDSHPPQASSPLPRATEASVCRAISVFRYCTAYM